MQEEDVPPPLRPYVFVENRGRKKQFPCSKKQITLVSAVSSYGHILQKDANKFLLYLLVHPATRAVSRGPPATHVTQEVFAVRALIPIPISEPPGLFYWYLALQGCHAKGSRKTRKAWYTCRPFQRYSPNSSIVQCIFCFSKEQLWTYQCPYMPKAASIIPCC